MFSKIYKKREDGFTMIELMIVVVIIGILAALAIPRFFIASTRSKQSEAKTVLKQIYSMERTYRMQNNTYWGAGVTADAANRNTFATIGVEIMPSSRYTFDIVTADAGNLLVRASAPDLDDDPAPDIWEIDHQGQLVPISDDAEI